MRQILNLHYCSISYNTKQERPRGFGGRGGVPAPNTFAAAPSSRSCTSQQMSSPDIVIHELLKHIRTILQLNFDTN
ncbi:hypothetical protein AHAS_Ahas18G0110500 [Arachis hypogaea]